jgi:hypothetical protein
MLTPMLRYAACLVLLGACAGPSTNEDETPTSSDSPPRPVEIETPVANGKWADQYVEQKQAWIHHSAEREKRTSALQKLARKALCGGISQGQLSLDISAFTPKLTHTLPPSSEPHAFEALGWLTLETPPQTAAVETDTQAFVAAFEQAFGAYTTLDVCDIHTFSFVEEAEQATIQISLHLSGEDSQQRPIEDHGKLTLHFGQDNRITSVLFNENIRIQAPKKLFEDVSAALLPGDRKPTESTRPMNLDTGGVSVVDVNADGLLDIYVSRDGPNLLYLQQADGQYKESAARYGITEPHNSRGVVFADFDHDGDDDLVVANMQFGEDDPGALEIYQRTAPEAFQKATTTAFGRALRDAFTHIAVADVDGDEDLDIFIGCYAPLIVPNHYVNADNGCRNLLWINQGKFVFKEEAIPRGMTHTDWTYAAGFVDIDEDGDQDLYVANDWGKNRFYLNNGSGHFEDIAPANKSNHPGAGMSVLWADIDNSGAFDLYVSNMYSNAGSRILPYSGLHQTTVKNALLSAAAGNVLYLDPTPQAATDVTASYAVADGGWAWGAIAFDYDLDGDQDIYQANGYLTGTKPKDQ